MVLLHHAGRVHRTGWAFSYQDGSSPGLVRARLYERRGLQVLDAMTTGLALVRVETYTPRGGWPRWGVEFKGPVIDLAEGEPWPMAVGRFLELTGWTPDGGAS